MVVLGEEVEKAFANVVDAAHVEILRYPSRRGL
jgi:hypothetical protein